jgi:hypothetical protein
VRPVNIAVGHPHRRPPWRPPPPATPPATPPPATLPPATVARAAGPSRPKHGAPCSAAHASARRRLAARAHRPPTGAPLWRVSVLAGESRGRGEDHEIGRQRPSSPEAGRRRRLAGGGGWLAVEVGRRRSLAGDGPQRTSGGAGVFSFLFFYFLLSELTSGPHQWHVHVSINIIFFACSALTGGFHPSVSLSIRDQSRIYAHCE